MQFRDCLNSGAIAGCGSGAVARAVAGCSSRAVAGCVTVVAGCVAWTGVSLGILSKFCDENFVMKIVCCDLRHLLLVNHEP